MQTYTSGMDMLFTTVVVGIGLLAIYLKSTVAPRPPAPRRHTPPDRPPRKSLPAAGWDLPGPTLIHSRHPESAQAAVAAPKAS